MDVMKMGMIKKLSKASFGYGLPAIPMLAVCVLLDPTTVLEWFATWVISLFVYAIIALVTTTIADEW